MTPMNNPIMAMASMAKSGMNPQALLMQMARSDPRAAQAMQMIQGKNAQQLKAMAENMARERGTSVAQVAQSLGLELPGR